MEKLIDEFKGKKIDVNCGSNAVYRGEVVESSNGVVRLRNEDGLDIYIAINKIAAVTECKDLSSRPGFIV